MCVHQERQISRQCQCENYSSTNDGTQTADIARLCSDGVEVDDEDVNPKNIAPPTAATGGWDSNQSLVVKDTSRHVQGDPLSSGPYHVAESFSGNSQAIRYTNKPAPEDFVNKFHDVRQLVIG
jgi:hypothetical protein